MPNWAEMPIGIALMAIINCQQLESLSLDLCLQQEDAIGLISDLPQSLTFLHLETGERVLESGCWSNCKNLQELELRNLQSSRSRASGLSHLALLTSLTLHSVDIYGAELQLPSLRSLQLDERSHMEEAPEANTHQLQHLSVKGGAFPAWASRVSSLTFQDRLCYHDTLSLAAQRLPPSGWAVRSLLMEIHWQGTTIFIENLLLLKCLRHLTIRRHEPPWSNKHGLACYRHMNVHDGPVIVCGNPREMSALRSQVILDLDASVLLIEQLPDVSLPDCL